MNTAAQIATPSHRVSKEWVLVLVAAGIVYVISLAPGPVWQDNGLIQCRVLRRDLFGELGLALSHPLYYMIAFAFQTLPFGESAYRTNLVSAVFGAITIANVFLLLIWLTGRRLPAAAGALSVGVAHTFWQHSALPETYTLAAALLSTELLFLLQYCRTERAGWLVWLFFINGLGISNHLLALLSLFCYAGVILFLTTRHRIGPRIWIASAAAWLGGASIYLTLIGMTLAHGGGVTDVVRSALFGGYARNVLNVHLGMNELRKTFIYLGLNFPTPTVLLAFLGMLAWRTESLRLFKITLLSLLLVHLAYAMRYNIPDQYTFFIPSVVLIGIWIGLGADVLTRKEPHWTKTTVILLGCVLPALIYFPLPCVMKRFPIKIGLTRSIPYRNEHEYFLHPWKTGYQGARDFAMAVQNTLPDGAVFIADSTTVRPIHYLQLTGQWSGEMTILPPLAGSPASKPSREWLETAASEQRLFVVSNIQPYCPDWILEKYDLIPEGPVYRVISPWFAGKWRQ